MSRRRTDPDTLRCMVCHARHYSWAELAEHERRCQDDVAERAERAAWAERQLRDLGYPTEGEQ